MGTTARSEIAMFLIFLQNAHWKAEQQAVEFSVEIGE